ncbi:MAG TPA: wax ester/triacylglycerol synthase family O-acyltransferase [Actinophytocola sp.]|jgi:WS/DGAT/MGAT family acyltransferase|uniref:wax ester/triacylglycerol synthase family O-acyltransferase n=1 Tax=Actinophytocola sp. TaxID=1872138 RepID=UPI002F93D5CA
MARLSGLDVAFLCLETRTRPMHLGAIGVFRPAGPVDLGELRELLASRAAATPLLRQRAHPVWFPPGGAEWRVDDRFRAAEHVRGYHVPDRRTFEAYASGWMATPLDLSRPPWEIHVVTGLPDDEFAVLLKLHHSLADGAGAVEVAGRLFDQSAPARPAPPSLPPSLQPSLPPTLDLLSQGRELLTRAGTVLLAARRPPAPSLVTGSSARRRLAFVRLDLDDVRQIRKQHGGTTNDVALTVVAGALRQWLALRNKPVDGVTLRALIPVNTRARGGADGANRLSAYLCDLPVGLADPLERLRFVRSAMDRNKAAGPSAGPGAVPILANLIPSALHRVCTPAAGAAAPLLFDTVVTNVPLPPRGLALAGAELREVYPFAPLAAGHGLGVAISAYRDSVHIGLQADHDAVPDLDVLAACLTKAANTLHERCA